MNLAEFRKKTQMYLRLVGQSQKSLANILFIHSTMLSHKLNGSDAAHLSALEVKQIIKGLAQWEAIDNQAQAIELLELMDLSVGSFKQQEWQSAPSKSSRPCLVNPISPPNV